MLKLFSNRRLLFLIIILVVSNIVITGVSLIIIYNKSISALESTLIDVVERQKALVTTLHEQGKSDSEIIQLIKIMREKHYGIGKTGEFAIAQKTGDSILYLLAVKDVSKININKSKLHGGPMRMALQGKNGFIVAEDYNGVPVYAAYIFVPILKWGIVAKIPTSEVNHPYYVAILTALFITILLILFCAFLFVKISNPIIKTLVDSEETYRMLFDSINDAVLISELTETGETGKIIKVNDIACQRLGYTREELLTKTPFDINSENAKQTVSALLKGLLEKKHAIIETEHVTKDGRIIPVEISIKVFQFRNKTLFHSVARDIAERKHAEENILNLNRVYAFISQINQTIVRTKDKYKLFENVCNIAIEHGKFQMAWIGLVDEETKFVNPFCFAGIEEGYLSIINKISVRDIPEGHGPTGTAIREDRYMVSNDIANNPLMAPWRAEALKRGYRSSIALPLKTAGKVIGALTLYATIPHFFDQEEIVLLEEVANDISFALESIETEEMLKESETSLLKHNEMFSILLDNLTQGVFMVEAPSGKPILANKAAKKILGRGILPDASMNNLGEVYKAFKADTLLPYPPEEMPIIQGMLGITKYIDDMIIEQPDGLLVNLEIFGTPVADNSGKIWASLVSFSDITERIKSKNELIKAKEKAEESDRLKTAFLQNMSHEIRTPMNAIMGFSDLLLSNADDKAKLKQFTEIISQRCSDLLDIINDILDISKIESGQLPINIEQCNLVDLFTDLTAFFTEYQKRINKQHIKFRLEAHCNPSESIIITDKVKLKQIFINLISNAFKFTDEGKVEGGCRYDKNQNLLFYVSDTGIGIPSDKQQFIFERFTQLQHSTRFNIGGTGLGLPIVKALINLLGGEIFLESEPDIGSTFSFKIPYKQVQPTLHQPLTIENINKESFIGKTILIVEDDPYNAVYIQEVLSGKGLNILQTENGKQAIEISVSQPIDLVLMDIRLPDINGYEATRQIKQHKPLLKIIAQTAYAASDEKQKAFEAGCIDYISKPTKKITLLTMLNKHLLS